MGLAGRKAHAAVECFLRPHGGSAAYSNPARSGPFISVLLSATLCSTLLSAFRFQHFSVSVFPPQSRGPAVSSSHPRFPLSDFSISAFQLFPLRPVVLWSVVALPLSAFQISEFQLLSQFAAFPISAFQ